ncbi:BRCT domain-containing protein At4g02110 [Magnolia sinica]|uniref:BRCT domain-containing protein At4g02110 n=1 Tax=Magnolia sinica TaxID=86752 RepID=UPI0026592AC5|nr:BRCT domain-containing protein At4g02110 [Magnolia sinica]
MFHGVRFVLIGFDSVSEAQYRSELLNGGGVDVGRYDSSCTHVIVHDRVYDDPVCVTARGDGKILITDLWVEDSLDLQRLADASRILYRPLKDLKGIPGSESLHICLTGYQRQARDDIMKMVELMGAQFSKPLIASKVTHLICYKFEGEKFELARKIGIKLVNHQWLEDCLRAWEILPVDKYNKSGWELEIMEAEARDSEEETEPGPGVFSSLNSGMLIHSSELPTPVREAPKIQQNAFTAGTSTHGSELRTPVREAPKIQQNASTAGTSTHGSELRTPVREAPKIQQNASTAGTSTHGSELRTPVREAPKIQQNVSTAGTSTHGSELCTTVREAPKIQQNASAAKGPLNISEDILMNKRLVSSPGKYTSFNEAPDYSVNNRLVSADSTSGKETSSSKGADGIEGFGYHNAVLHVSAGSGHGMLDGGIGEGISNLDDKVTKLKIEGNMPFSDQRTSKRSPDSNLPVENSVLCFSRKTPKRSAASLSPTPSTHLRNSPQGNLEENTVAGALTFEQARNDPASSEIPIPTVHTEKHHKEGTHNTFPQKRKLAVSRSGLGLPKARDHNVTGSPQNTAVSAEAEHATMMVDEPHSKINPHIMNNSSPSEGVSAVKCVENQHANASKTKSAKSLKRGRTVLAIKISDNSGSSSDGMVKGDIKSSHMLGEQRSVSDTTDYLGTMAINNKSAVETNQPEPMAVDGRSLVETSNEEKSPETSSRGSKGSASGTKPDVGMSKSSNLPVIEIGDPQKSPNGIQSKTEKFESTANARTLAERNGIASSTKLRTKLLAKKTVGYKHKPSMSNTSKGSSASHPDKTDMPGEVENGKDGVEPKKMNSDVNVEMADSTHKRSDVIMEEKVERIPCSANKPKNKAVALDAKEEVVDAEKENKPTENGVRNVNSGKRGRQKAAAKKSNPLSVQNTEKAVGTDADRLQAGRSSRTGSSELTWFLLSGHRLQRKEFQQVIRRLRGRLCRDSHHWSYQATHFIVPDPVRRTEKFFAAAAAGRWILKTDYLSASSQAGRFLAEEPFEWYKSGLSEDGAINLEAPRKWRLLRERTGHGAFYGMHIVIYGECITPPLDTLKRVVKAGGGTILATSPPYTRFLKSGVDFAVISPGMPRVDCWVQEFMRHEIPCIAADYLVEYVCKPGYSLERHVLYKTHAWAEKSFANLSSRSEEIIEASTPSEDGNDISCEVCGSRDRGEVMLICGDEGGTLGCGVGTHIDCCNPPLEAVPKEDWFCSKC